MVLSKAIWTYLEPLYIQCLNEKDKKIIKELKKKIKILNKEYEQALDREYYELKKDDVLGNYNDLEYHNKKILSDSQYNNLMEKWSNIVGEKLLTQTQQNYNDAKSILMKSIKDIMTPEEIKEELRKFDYDWAHRKEEIEDRKRRRQEHIQYVNMINSMTPEELKRFRSLRDEDPERDKLYKSVSEVKTKDEE